MVTRLTKPLARTLEHDGAWYKIVLSAEGIRVTRKNARLGTTISWEEVLAFAEQAPPESVEEPIVAEDDVAPRERTQRMPDAVAADVLILMRRANEALAEASSLIDNASEVPALLARRREPPPPREEERADWYIEPLLTLRQVSRLLGVSSSRVRRLPLRSIDLGGEVRYQPAELRRFMAVHSR